jgi:salicylate hydroxylase
MMYMVLGASTLNVVLSHPDDIDTSQWNSDMMSKEIKHQFEGWDPW